MNKMPCTLKMLLTVLLIVPFSIKAQVSIFTIDELQSAIAEHNLEIDFILIDVRDNDAVDDGIIASIYCKPYHLSWNDSVFHHAIKTIPSDIPVMIYDQTGTFAMQAAKILADSGQKVIAAIAGGVNAYQGTLSDTSFLKPAELLPEPSYFGDLSGTTYRKRKSGGHEKPFAVFTHRPNQQQHFTLLGRKIPSERVTVNRITSGCIIIRSGQYSRRMLTGGNSYHHHSFVDSK